jgi:ribosomal-protein-alanine N-acetyltransferase
MSVVSVSIRPLQVHDAGTLAELYSENRAFLEPFDPPRPQGFATVAAQERELKALERERAADRLERFLISADDEPAGVISVSRITRGPFQNAGLGYWVIERMNGRGIATDAVRLVCEWGFGEAGFHRLEAATLVDNTASQTVLRRNRFTEIGLSRRYLFINGAWRDHILFARTAEDDPTTGV